MGFGKIRATLIDSPQIDKSINYLSGILNMRFEYIPWRTDIDCFGKLRYGLLVVALIFGGPSSLRQFSNSIHIFASKIEKLN